MASMESLVSGMIVGVLYGLFSGQPLTIMSLTGPILVFDTILYDFCKLASQLLFFLNRIKKLKVESRVQS